jgi:hypothetical protein
MLLKSGWIRDMNRRHLSDPTWLGSSSLINTQLVRGSRFSQRYVWEIRSSGNDAILFRRRRDYSDSPWLGVGLHGPSTVPDRAGVCFSLCAICKMAVVSAELGGVRAARTWIWRLTSILWVGLEARRQRWLLFLFALRLRMSGTISSLPQTSLCCGALWSTRETYSCISEITKWDEMKSQFRMSQTPFPKHLVTCNYCVVFTARTGRIWCVSSNTVATTCCL